MQNVAFTGRYQDCKDYMIYFQRDYSNIVFIRLILLAQLECMASYRKATT